MFTYDGRTLQGTCCLVCDGHKAADFCRCTVAPSGNEPAQYIDAAHTNYAFAAYLLGYAHWQAGGIGLTITVVFAGTGSLSALVHMKTTGLRDWNVMVVVVVAAVVKR